MVKCCHTLNKNGETPEQMARKKGNTELADLLSSYVVQQRDKRKPNFIQMHVHIQKIVHLKFTLLQTVYKQVL